MNELKQIKPSPIYTLPKRDTFQKKGQTQTESEDMEQDILYKRK